MNVYLDNAASSPLDAEVLEYMLPFLSMHHGNPSSTHSHGRLLKAELEKARRTIANCLGASPGEIIFTSGGTEADNMALCGAVAAYGLTHIISTRIEHHAVTHTIEHLAQSRGVTPVWLTPDEHGRISLQELEKALKAHPQALVSLMHANNEIGTLLDIEAVARMCAAHQVLFHSDTVQCMGQMRYNLSELPVHFVTASAHKFNGPKGVGFLYIKNGVKIPPHIHGGSQERGLRAGTENLPFIAGMAFALEKACSQLEEKRAKLLSLKQYMQQQLQRHIPGVSFNGPTAENEALPTVLNVAFPCGEEDAMLTFHLDLAGISASGGSACSSGSNQGSHVLAGIGCSKARAMNSVRFSFGPQNTPEEIDYTVQKLREIIKAPVM